MFTGSFDAELETDGRVQNRTHESSPAGMLALPLLTLAFTCGLWWDLVSTLCYTGDLKEKRLASSRPHVRYI